MPYGICGVTENDIQMAFHALEDLTSEFSGNGVHECFGRNGWSPTGPIRP